MISKAKLALIHIAKTKTGMTDNEYRDFLKGFGVKSSKDLNDHTFSKAMDAFKKLGFKKMPKKNKRRPEIEKLPITKEAMMQKIEAIVLDMNLSWEYIHSIAKKRFGVDNVTWCNTDQVYKLLQMMVIHQNRQT